jgi:hypothetical protein
MKQVCYPSLTFVEADSFHVSQQIAFEWCIGLLKSKLQLLADGKLAWGNH